jgi:hypothetical protein
MIIVIAMKGVKNKRFEEAEKMAHEIKKGMAKKLMKDLKELRKSRPRFH